MDISTPLIYSVINLHIYHFQLMNHYTYITQHTLIPRTEVVHRLKTHTHISTITRSTPKALCSVQKMLHVGLFLV